MSILSPYELDSLAAAYPHLDLAPLPTQHEQLLLARLRGLNVGAAAAAAGMSIRSARDFLRTEKAKVILDFAIKETRSLVAVDRDLLSTMLFEAHDVAATSGEKISAIRELGNLHNLYPGKKPAQVAVTQITTNNVTTAKQLEKLKDDELLKLSGLSIDPEELAPVSTPDSRIPEDVIEGEFSEVPIENP